MVYAGEELGLTVKPSIIGADIRGQDGRLSETSQLQFRSEGDMRGMMRRLLSHRPSDMAFLQVRVRETGGMVAYVRLRPGSGELWLVAINLRNCENWGQVKDCFPTFDFPEWSFGWRELLEWAGIHGDYHLNELLQDHDMGTREVSDEIWLGLEAGGAQILRLETMA
jgi:hypothetical protein